MADDRQHQDLEKHQVLMINRQYAEITGVVNVESFDAREFLLQTAKGVMAIRGQGLHIKALHLENGLVSIEGAIGDIQYFDDKGSAGAKAKGLFGKLLK